MAALFDSTQVHRFRDGDVIVMSKRFDVLLPQVIDENCCNTHWFVPLCEAYGSDLFHMRFLQSGDRRFPQKLCSVAEQPFRWVLLFTVSDTAPYDEDK